MHCGWARRRRDGGLPLKQPMPISTLRETGIPEANACLTLPSCSQHGRTKILSLTANQPDGQLQHGGTLKRDFEGHFGESKDPILARQL